ncbi:hypothetical protein ACIGQE_27930 [Streptomyces sp. NPDC053429]|uniref:hypothetical protein n=1 Tax=Streptomyces sp. NPDC053429 TaxID=3365702 RepID=UPI0037D19DC9
MPSKPEPSGTPWVDLPERFGSWKGAHNLDHTTATALYDPKHPYNEAVAAFYVQASGGLGTLYAPVLSLTAGDTGRSGLLAYINGLRFIEIEPFDTSAALAAIELLHAGHPWATVHAIHAAGPRQTSPLAATCSLWSRSCTRTPASRLPILTSDAAASVNLAPSAAPCTGKGVKLDQLDAEAARRPSTVDVGTPTFADVAIRTTTTPADQHCP